MLVKFVLHFCLQSKTLNYYSNIIIYINALRKEITLCNIQQETSRAGWIVDPCIVTFIPQIINFPRNHCTYIHVREQTLIWCCGSVRIHTASTSIPVFQHPSISRNINISSIYIGAIFFYFGSTTNDASTRHSARELEERRMKVL